jgi:hypothetical protein
MPLAWIVYCLSRVYLISAISRTRQFVALVDVGCPLGQRCIWDLSLTELHDVRAFKIVASS